MSSASANRIKQFRNSLGLSQRAFAYEIGSTPATVARNEISEGSPAKPLLDKIVKRYGVSRDWVLTGVGTPIPGKPALDPSTFQAQAQKVIARTAELIPAARVADAKLHPNFADDVEMIQLLPHARRAPDALEIVPIFDPDALISLPKSWFERRWIPPRKCGVVQVMDDDMRPTMTRGAWSIVRFCRDFTAQSTIALVFLDGNLCLRRLDVIERDLKGHISAMSLRTDSGRHATQEIGPEDRHRLVIAGQVFGMISDLY